MNDLDLFWHRIADARRNLENAGTCAGKAKGTLAPPITLEPQSKQELEDALTHIALAKGYLDDAAFWVRKALEARR